VVDSRNRHIGLQFGANLASLTSTHCSTMPSLSLRQRRLRETGGVLLLHFFLYIRGMFIRTIRDAINDAFDSDSDSDSFMSTGLSDSEDLLSTTSAMSNGTESDSSTTHETTDSDDSSTDSEDDETNILMNGFPATFLLPIVEEFVRVSETRYLVPRVNLPKTEIWIRNIVGDDPDKRFRMFFRMSQPSVANLLRLIERHPIFYNESTMPQRPVSHQLLTFLFFMAADGSAGSWVRIGAQMGIGEGTVQLYVNRVLTAILSREEELIVWPDPNTESYRKTTDLHLLRHGLPDCLGFVDGTQFPIFRKPIGDNGKAYYDRHDRYSFNATVIVDADTRILYTALGCEIPSVTTFLIFNRYRIFPRQQRTTTDRPLDPPE
jgi:hypothetical protein